LGSDRAQLFLEAEVALPAGAVEERGLAVDAPLGHGAEQGQDRGHPRSAAHEDQVRFGFAQGEHAERAAQLQAVAHVQLLVEELREQPVRVHLDHEFEQPVSARCVGHRERADLVGAWHGEVHVLAGEELDFARLDQPQHQVAHVVRHRVLGHHLGDGLLDRQAGADHVRVVVE
jgi:hypothetical protein